MNGKIKSAGFLISVLKKSKLSLPENLIDSLKEISNNNKDLLKILKMIE